MGDKTDATWHPNGGPFTVQTDLIERAARAMFEVGGVEDGDWTWADVVRDEPERAVLWRNDAAQVVAALGDTVPREQYDAAWVEWRKATADCAAAERERDEARAERDALQRGVVAATERAEAAEAESDALAHVLDQVRAVVDDVSRWRGYGAQRPQLVAILDAAPLVSLARHDAEVKARALDEAKQIVTNVCRDVLSDYYGQVRVEVNAALDSRAAAIRAEANG